MSIGVAFILMSASVSDDSIFYNKDGFIGLDGADSCFLSSEYENGIKTNILAKKKSFTSHLVKTIGNLLLIKDIILRSSLTMNIMT